MFGCKQSSGGSQALVFVCLQLLRQLGVSQELPNSTAARAEPMAQQPRSGMAENGLPPLGKWALTSRSH